MTIAEGYAERFVPKTTGQIVQRYTATMSAAVAQVEPDGYELTRAGRRFQIGTVAAATGIAPVQALPTTAAHWVIFNTDLKVSLVFDWLGMYNVSGTAGAGIVVIATIFTTPAQTGLATGVSITNNANASRSSVASIKSAVTITAPAAPIWVPVATNMNANTALLDALTVNTDLRGRIVVPPLSGLGLATLSPTGSTPLFAPVACWTELESDLE
jgi:hypothetical protein